jgi:hypothetical protein
VLCHRHSFSSLLPVDVHHRLDNYFCSKQGNAQAKEAFIEAAKFGDLAKVKVAVEKHKLDPNDCKDVSADNALQCCRRGDVSRRVEGFYAPS